MDEEIILFLKNIITKAGDLAIDLRNKELIVNRKEDKSPVTNADIAISNFIYENLTSLDLKFPIICEEQPIINLNGSRYFWLVDPIDGTKSFIRNEDNFTINIALICDRKPILGFVYQPACGKLYYTDHLQKLHIEINGQIYNYNTNTNREKSDLVAIVSSHHFNQQTAKYLKDHKFSEIISVPSSIKFCMIAEGVGDVYPKFGPTMEWDTAAGHAIVNASGGKVVDLSGKSLLYEKNRFKNSDFLVFGNQCLHRFNL
ncbi:MAG: 3'(2'),5'-bisphosphate nucleotidase CysQ [Rickettsiaceae bacterium]|nr:3'(2'),5'-bisphosphate nucleotidase CysQ [Rickettsiaceae bacterium]